MMFSAGTLTFVKKTSANSELPVICLSGRTSTPGLCISRMKYEMPWCLGTLGFVRASRMPKSAYGPRLVQTFWPLITHRSPSRTALVLRLARSEPESGSEYSWHQMSSAVSMRRT